MPTATSTSQLAISNIGPLTTVFTAPTACATASRPLYLAQDNSIAQGRIPVFYQQKCERVDWGECYPSGKQIDDAYNEASSKGFPDAANTLAYFSPASACPDAYTTVGVAAKGADGNVSSSGVFVPPLTTGQPRTGGTWIQNPPINVFMEVLDKGETAVVCCPQNYTVGVQGGCYSSVPQSVYGERTACQRVVNNDDYTAVTATFTYNDTLVTGVVNSYTVSSRRFSTRNTTISASALTQGMSAVAFMPAVTLVHGGEVTGTASGTTESGTGAPTETPNAAGALRMTGGMGLLATAWAVAALAGAVLATQW